MVHPATPTSQPSPVLHVGAADSSKRPHLAGVLLGTLGMIHHDSSVLKAEKPALLGWWLLQLVVFNYWFYGHQQTDQPTDPTKISGWPVDPSQPRKPLRCQWCGCGTAGTALWGGSAGLGERRWGTPRSSQELAGEWLAGDLGACLGLFVRCFRPCNLFDTDDVNIGWPFDIKSQLNLFVVSKRKRQSTSSRWPNPTLIFFELWQVTNTTNSTN